MSSESFDVDHVEKVVFHLLSTSLVDIRKQVKGDHPLAFLVHYLLKLSEAKSRDMFGVAKMTLGGAVEMLLEDAVRLFFTSEQEPASTEDKHWRRVYQFGVYHVKTRVKAPESVARKLLGKHFKNNNEATSFLKQIHTFKFSEESVLLTAQGHPVDLDTKVRFLKKLNEIIRDLYGIKLVVLSQRSKSNIARATNLVIENASEEMFARLNSDIENNPEREGSKHKYKFYLSNLAGEPWFIYNPPAGYLYSSPASVQKFFDGVSRLAAVNHEGAPKQVSEYQNKMNALIVSKSSMRDIQVLSESLTALDELGFDIVFRASGYSSFQRVFKVVCFDASQEDSEEKMTLIFELQVRTLLEDAWAEPEHRLSYKPGKPLSESTKVLFRNYGAQLVAADDMLQVISDRWQEETSSFDSLFKNSIHDYPRIGSHSFKLKDKDHPSTFEALEKDLARAERLHRQGHVSTALAFVRRMGETYNGISADNRISAEVNALLMLEEVRLMADLSDTQSKWDILFLQLETIKQYCKENELLSEGFAASFRLIVCRINSLKCEVRHNDLKSMEASQRARILVECSKVKGDLDELICLFENHEEHITEEYNMSCFPTDVACYDVMCDLLIYRLAESNEVKYKALEDGLVRAYEGYAHTAVEITKVGTTNRLVAIRKVVKYFERHNEGKIKDMEKDVDFQQRHRDLHWFVQWSANAALFCLLEKKCFCNSQDDNRFEMTEKDDARLKYFWDLLVTLEPNRKLICEYMNGEAVIEDVQKLVDAASMMELKIIDTLIHVEKSHAKRSDKLNLLRSLFGCIRHRLVEICCLGEHGFERAFFLAVDAECRGIDKLLESAHEF